VARVAALGARFVTLHASGGPTMLRRAVERAKSSGTNLEIVAVTVLTSMDQDDLLATGIDTSLTDHARKLARLAYDQGVRAFVCSPRELGVLRSDLGKDAVLISPGIRATDGSQGDQKRVATAAQAIRDGADWLVVGRPIRDAKDPAEAAAAIAEEARLAQRSRPADKSLSAIRGS
jgi:orotidine-5'-phosphate decarboxylase